MTGGRSYVRKGSRGWDTGELVDARPAMDHVRSLVGKGMSIAAIAKKSGCSTRTIYGYYNGWVYGGGVKREVRRCGEMVLRDVLAVEFEQGWDPSVFSPKKFRALRESQGLSRVVLGKMAGFSPEGIQYWEDGRSQPKRLNNLERVLEALGADLEDVCGPVVETEQDEYVYVEERPFDPEADFIPNYPCGVCKQEFRSRTLLATHPHPKMRKS